MVEIKSASYEECRAEHFKKLMWKMQRKIDYWQHRGRYSLEHQSVLSRAYHECSEAGMQYNFYKDALDALSAAPKWVSVEERLPHEYETVIVCADDGCVYAAQYWGREMWRRELIGCARSDTDVTPTHWMYLPEPPKEDA